MAAIQMRCPQCDLTVDVPEELVDEGHRCYKCGIPVEIASKAVAIQRERVRGGERAGLLIGGCIGALLVLAFWAIGGPVGGAIAGGAAGAAVGVAFGFIQGLAAGFEWSVVMWDSSWSTGFAKLFMVLGGILGTIAGISGAVARDYGEWSLPVLGSLGGMCLGGVLGVRLGRASASHAQLDPSTSPSNP